VTAAIEIDEDAQHPRAPISTRARPPRPKRLSRKAIVALTGTAAGLVAAALVYSLSEDHRRAEPPQRVSVEASETDLLASAPRDYADLAEKAAGDIGPPPSAEEAPAAQLPGEQPTGGNAPRSAAEERKRQQAESARSSRLFASAGERGVSQPAKLEIQRPADGGPVTDGKQGPAGRHAAFVAGAAEPTTNSGRLEEPPGRYVLSAGSTIAAALMTGLNSDLPGQVVAQVTEDVFDSATGRTRIIPQGSRLIGSYDDKVGYGETRALLVWSRLVLPDGRSLQLDRLAGTDGAGRSGLTDRVDNHWGSMLKAGAVSTLLGVGAAITELGENGEIANAIRDSAGQTIGRAGDRIVEKQLGVQPTIVVRPGARVRVLVSRDLVLEPWAESKE
jgi:type IV secretion system protein VirB10